MPAAKPKLAQPPPDPIGKIFVPSGTTDLDADEARHYIEQALADAIARAGIEARTELGAPVSGGKNASVMWFDFSALFAGLPPEIAQKLSDAFVKIVLTKGLVTTDVKHKMQAEWLATEGNQALFARIGAPAGAKVLQFAATNVGDLRKALGQANRHAEEFILLQLERALRIVVTEYGTYGLTLKGDAQIRAAIAAAALAVYSDRQNCGDRCAPVMQKLFAAARNVALVYYDANNAPVVAKRLLERLITASAVPLAQLRVDERIIAALATNDQIAIGKEQQSAAGRKRVEELRAVVAAAGTATGESACGGTPAVGHGPASPGDAVVAGGVTSPGSAASSGGAGIRAMAAPIPVAAGPRAAGDCGDSKVTSVLGQLLAAVIPAGKYGGVDFSSLSLRYVSDSGEGARFSYSAGALPGGYQQDQALGSRVVQMTAADLRTWLVLRPDTFWVNLDPQEPDRIIDAQLGKTNAGRAMLDADLAMKRTSGRLINPNTAFGKRYWDAMTAGSTGTVCFSSRVWIVPGEIRVREEGSSLYVLQADLDVKTESELGRGLGAECPPVDPATDERRERIERELVLPQIVKAVNTAPEYAPLRRAFMARVVAQWIRQRHESGRRTSYDDIIGTGLLGPAELRDGWKPRQVFDEFVKSYNQKEFKYSITTRQGNQVLVSQFTFGGVDWSNVTYDGVSEDQMKADYGHVADTVRSSADRLTTAPDGSIWLGASTPAPERSTWDRTVGRLSFLKDGKTTVVAIAVLALLALTFGFKGPRRKTPPPASPTP